MRFNRRRSPSLQTVLAAAAIPAPLNTVAPVISGTAKVGETLNAGTGTWSYSPTSFAYQWKRGGSAISGATSATYLLVSGDNGSNITCDVTATNASGSTTATSNSLGPVTSVMSYEDWLAAETARSTGGSLAWGGSASLTPGIYRTTAAAATGTLYGTPWQGRMGVPDPNAPCRVVQHGLPSEAVFNAQVAAGRMITFDIEATTDNFSGGITRNGFTSTGPYGGGDGAGIRVIKVRYYDNALGPLEMNPFAGTGPTPYTP